MTRRYDRPAALLAVLAATFAPLYGWAVRSMLRRNLARLWAGDPEPLLATYAEDVRFVFPGRSSWAANIEGKDGVRRWLERFVRVGLRLEVREILVDGPPWDTTACLWFTDRLAGPGGEPVYENRGTIVAKIAWGKVVYYEVNEDTQKVEESRVREVLAGGAARGPAPRPHEVVERLSGEWGIAADAGEHCLLEDGRRRGGRPLRRLALVVGIGPAGGPPTNVFDTEFRKRHRRRQYRVAA